MTTRLRPATPSLSTSSSISSDQDDQIHPPLDVQYLCERIAEYILDSVALTDSIPDFIPSHETLQFEITSTPHPRVPPTIDQISKLALYLYHICQLEYECLLSSYIYLQKLYHLTSGVYRLTRSNWRVSLLLCYLLSSKLLDDFSMENKDFSIAFGLISLQELNSLERKLVELMNFNLYLSREEYQRCYAELLLERHENPLPPLTPAPLSASSSSPPKEREEETRLRLMVASSPSSSSSPLSISRRPVVGASVSAPAPSLKTNLEVQILSKGVGFLSRQISPHSIALSSFSSPCSSPLFGSIHRLELLSLTRRTSSSLSDLIFSCFEKRIEEL
jgi:hypothetical protein